MELIKAGDILLTWCSRHALGATPPGERTPHRYEPGGKAKLVCIKCEEGERDGQETA